MGLEPTHQKGNPVEGVGLSRLEDGKVVENHSQWDTLKFMKDIGAIPEGAAIPAGS